MTPKEKAQTILDALLKRLNIPRPRGTYVEACSSVAFVRYNAEIVARCTDNTKMSDAYVASEVSRIVRDFGLPKQFPADYADDPI